MFSFKSWASCWRVKHHIHCFRSKLTLDCLENRQTPSIPQHLPGPETFEVYQWAIINEMRADPSAFADKLQALYNGTSSAWGFTGNDPVWDDIRTTVGSKDGQVTPKGTWRFSDTLALLRSQPQLGPLALDAQLSQDAFGHVNWMTSHAYGHSVDIRYQNDPSQWQEADQGKSIVGFVYHPLGSSGFQPDFVNLDKSVYYHSVGDTEWFGWSEDIGNVGFGSSTMAAFNKDGNQALFYRRAAFFDIMGYLIDWGNGAYTDQRGEFHPNDGHLRNLLSHDQGDLPEDGSSQAKPKNKEIGNRNSIGIDFYLYNDKQPANLSGTANNFASTHRLAYRGRPDGRGGIITFLMYRDSNGDSFFTPGEERQYNISVSGQTPTFTLSPASGTASLLETQNGIYNIIVTDPATGRSGKGSITLNNGNVAVTIIDTGMFLKITSSSANQSVTGLNLTDTYGRTLATSTPITLPTGGGTFKAETTLRSGAANLFSLTVPAGSTLMAQTSLPGGAAAPLDTYLRLFDASGNQLATNDDGGGNFYSLLSYPFAQGGTYYVGVSGGGNTAYDPRTGIGGQPSQEGDYALSLVVAPPPVIGPEALPTGQVGTVYGQSLSASGPSGPFKFAINSGTLPPGIALAPTGVLSGTPTVAGNFVFTITAMTAAGGTGSLTYNISVTLPPQHDNQEEQTAGGATRGVEFRQFIVGTGTGGGAITLYNPDNSVAQTLTPFGSGFTDGVRVAAADFNGDGVADIVVGTGPGGPSHVVILDGKTGATLFQIDPFEASFTGGVFVTTGDLNGAGYPDLIITPDQGGGPRVQVFDGKTFTKVVDFFGIADPNFRGGARTAIGDVLGNGYGDLIVAAGFGGGPRISVLDGKSVVGGNPTQLLPDFFAFEPGLRNGVYVAAGDLDGAGHADLIFGGGPGGGPRVRAVDPATLMSAGGFGSLDDANVQSAQVANFFAGDTNNRGGIRVAVKNLDGDNKADLVTGAGEGGGSRVTTYAGKSIQPDGTPDALSNFDAFPSFTGGVFVG